MDNIPEHDNTWEAAISLREDEEKMGELYIKIHKFVEDREIECPICGILCCSDDCLLAILADLYSGW